MTDIKLKERLAYILLVAKVTVLGWVIFLQITGDYESSEAAITIAILLPLFSTNLTVIVRELLENKHKDKYEGAELRSVVVALSLVIPVAYTLYMVLVINLVPAVALKIEEMVSLLGLGETMFGVYLGIIISSLFEKKQHRQKNR